MFDYIEVTKEMLQDEKIYRDLLNILKNWLGYVIKDFEKQGYILHDNFNVDNYSKVINRYILQFQQKDLFIQWYTSNIEKCYMAIDTDFSTGVGLLLTSKKGLFSDVFVKSDLSEMDLSPISFDDNKYELSMLDTKSVDFPHTHFVHTLFVVSQYRGYNIGTSLWNMLWTYLLQTNSHFNLSYCTHYGDETAPFISKNVVKSSSELSRNLEILQNKIDNIDKRYMPFMLMYYKI